MLQWLDIPFRYVILIGKKCHHTLKHIHALTYVHALSLSLTHTHVSLTHTHTHAHTCMHTHVCMHTHTRRHTHTQLVSWCFDHIHTHTHTHKSIYIWKQWVFCTGLLCCYSRLVFTCAPLPSPLHQIRMPRNTLCNNKGTSILGSNTPPFLPFLKIYMHFQFGTLRSDKEFDWQSSSLD